MVHRKKLFLYTHKKPPNYGMVIFLKGPKYVCMYQRFNIYIPVYILVYGGWVLTFFMVYGLHPTTHHYRYIDSLTIL